MPTFDTRKVKRRSLSPRESVLFSLGVLFFIMGANILIVHTINQVPWEYHTFMPLWFKAGKFLIAGTVCIVSVWTQRFQGLGFGLLMLPPMLRLTSFIVALVASFVVPVDFYSYMNLNGFTIWELRGILLNSCLLWAIVAFLIYKIAQMQDPPEVPIIDYSKARIQAETVLLVEPRDDDEGKN